MSETGESPPPPKPTSTRRDFLRNLAPVKTETNLKDETPNKPPLDLSATTGRRDFIRDAAVVVSTAAVATTTARPALNRIADWAFNRNPQPERPSSPLATDAPTATTEAKQLERVITPEERIKEVGLDRFQGFFDTYKYYEQKYGPAIADFSPGDGAKFPVVKELVKTLTEVVDPNIPINEAAVAMWRDGWGTERSGAAAAAHEHVGHIQMTGDSVFKQGMHSILGKIADIVPPVALAFPDTMGQKSGGGGYGGDNIDTTYYTDNPGGSIYTALHEGMHSVLNTRILTLKKFLEPDAFASFTTTLLDSVGRSVDMFLDSSYEQLGVNDGLRLYVTEADSIHFRDQQVGIREMLGRYPDFFNPEEIRMAESRLQENDGIDSTSQVGGGESTVPEPPGIPTIATITNKRNFYSQLIGRKARDLRMTDPDNPFLAEQIVQDEMKELTMHYAHQFVFAEEGIMVDNPSGFHQMQRNVWNEFMKAASPLPNPTLEGFQTEIEKYMPQEEKRLFESFGLTEIASSTEDTPPKTPYQVYALPGDSNEYYVSFSDAHGNRFSYIVASDNPSQFEGVSVSTSQEVYTPEGALTGIPVDAFRLNYIVGNTTSSVLLRAFNNNSGENIPDGNVISSDVRITKLLNAPEVIKLESETATQVHWKHKNTDGVVLEEKDVNLAFLRNEKNIVAIDTGEITQIDNQALKFESAIYEPREKVIIRDAATLKSSTTQQFYPEIFNTNSYKWVDDIDYSEETEEYIIAPQKNAFRKDGWGFKLGAEAKTLLDLTIEQNPEKAISVSLVFVEKDEEKSVPKKTPMIKMQKIDIQSGSIEDVGYIKPDEVFSIEQSRP